jgi:hypothetical protein
MLAPSRYEDWKEVEIKFDTHEALAGLKPTMLPPAAAQSSPSAATATASLSERFDAAERLHAQSVAQTSTAARLVSVGCISDYWCRSLFFADLHCTNGTPP